MLVFCCSIYIWSSLLAFLAGGCLLYLCRVTTLSLLPLTLNVSADPKQVADQDETPPHTPTGNTLSYESDIEVSSPTNELVPSSNDPVVSQEEDERLAKELSLKEAAAHDLSHRPKRRRFHESYNFNMKCPTPGCNSLGEGTLDQKPSFSVSTHEVSLFISLSALFNSRTSNWAT